MNTLGGVDGVAMRTSEMLNIDKNYTSIIELCYFIIKYFDKFEIDYTVGLGGMKPQIWFVPDDLNKSVIEADELTLDRYEKNSNDIFENLKKYGIKKLL